jgi:predicted oxidoreductase (fatty acid repression mutant protein)
MATFKSSTEAFLEVVKGRRTIYQLNKDLGPVSTSQIQELVKQSTLHTPSSFNSQSNRLLVLFGAEHDKLWDIVRDTLKAIVPAENWQSTADRVAGFKAGAGTILFFDDRTAVKKMQDGFPLYADKFPGFASQSLAMQQYILWATLENEGLGANLQHYNPLIDQKVAAEWGVPETWELNAQLVFGGRGGEAGPKEFQAIEERVKVFGA